MRRDNKRIPNTFWCVCITSCLFALLAGQIPLNAAAPRGRTNSTPTQGILSSTTNALQFRTLDAPSFGSSSRLLRTESIAIASALPLASSADTSDSKPGSAQPSAGTASHPYWEKLKRGGRIVCLGDSVTGVYYHTGGKRAYTDMFGMALQKSAPQATFNMINAGISGNTTINGLDRLDRDVLQRKPDLVTVMFGLNDMTRVPADQYRANLVTIVQRCEAAGAKVMLCTPNNVIDTGSRPIVKLDQYCAIVREVGKTLGIPVADCYAGMEVLRKRDADRWRLLLSDEIHPNLDGHKRMAEIMSQVLTGQTVNLDDAPITPPSLAGVEAAIKANRKVKVLAMPPYDAEIKEFLLKRFPTAQLDIVKWEVSDRTLPQLDQDAKERVRALHPDLVVIAVPRTAKSTSREELIRSYSWVMNWSLSFGLKEWECVVVHPAVADPDHPDAEYDTLVRQLVKAQDLHLIDRKEGDKRTTAEILAAGLVP